MLFRLADITKSYGGIEILRGFSFQVNQGEKLGLVGRNGAGKTTAFRIITGTESADLGEVLTMNNLKLGLLEQHVDFDDDETVHTAALSSFRHIHDIEAEIRRLEKLMETDASEPVLEKYADLQHAFELADGFTYAAKAESVLLGLGFTKENWDLKTTFLSGGQKNRLGMARVLLSSPDVLLLDEPTNHLDVSAVEWLEDFLKNYDGSYVVISHDRYFLDRTTNKIVEIDRGKAISYKGNYSAYLVEREIRREQRIREYENQRSMIAKTEEFIRRNLEGQKTKQAKSRRNMLERMDRIESVAAEKHGGSFKLKKVERAGNNVLTTEDLTIGYADKVLARGLNFSLHRGEALGIIGANGTGKTTLLKTILGELRELSGKILWGTKTEIGYYSQSLSDLEPRNEVIQELRRVAPLAESGELRNFLARFLFFGEDVFKVVSDLSGGEKGRLSLAKLIYSQKNVLILDEPTNHLDIPAREALEDTLEEYPGTIITVSHDRFFLDKIASQILAFEPNGTTEWYGGNYTEYHDWRAIRDRLTVRQGDVEIASKGKKQPEQTVPLPTEEPSLEISEQKGRSGLSKNQVARLKARINEIEQEIPELEERMEQLSLEMGLPEIAAEFEKLNGLAEQQSAAQRRIRDLYSEWEQISEELA